MNEFTDIHAHLVYGMDDGAQTRKEMEAMLDAAYADGISVIYATPHVTPGVYPFDEAAYAQRMEEAREYCRQKGYPLKLHTGAELMYTPAMDAQAAAGKLITLEDSDRILVEFVPDISFDELEHALRRMQRAEYIVVIAHMERYDCLYHGSRAYELKRRFNIRYQVNCNSIISGVGFLRKGKLKHWLKDELIDFVATDSHNTGSRKTRMRKAYRILKEQYGYEYAARLTGQME